MPPVPIIACVDDDIFVCEAIKGLLEASGFAAEGFSSAEELLQSGRLEHAACVITDVQLRGMSGLQLQDRLASSGAAIPVIVITAFPDTRVRAQALGAGAVGFFSKPLATMELLACIGSALDRPHGNGVQH